MRAGTSLRREAGSVIIELWDRDPHEGPSTLIVFSPSEWCDAVVHASEPSRLTTPHNIALVRAEVERIHLGQRHNTPLPGVPVAEGEAVPDAIDDDD